MSLKIIILHCCFAKFSTKSRTKIRWCPHLSVTKISKLFKLKSDTLPSPIALDEHTTWFKMTSAINRVEAREIGYDWSYPALTLCSTWKHTIRLAQERNELDFYPDLDFRSLGRQGKSENQKRKDTSVIRTLNFNHDHGLVCFALFVMSFVEVVIRLLVLVGMNVQNFN